MSREEDAYVIERMGKLLAEIAIIVNGTEPHDTLWSYHDLPEKVRALKQAQQPAAAVSAPVLGGELCGCGRPADYTANDGGWCCNKYGIRCKAQQPAAAVPEGYRVVPVAELADALASVESVMQDAYNRGHQACCGHGYSECCGNPIVEWEPADDAIMSGLQPARQRLAAMLFAANKDNNNAHR